MKKTRLVTLSLASAMLIAGCTPVQTVRGNFLKDYQIESVQPMQDTKSDVIRKLGSPTTISTFDENQWYYLGQEMNKHGIFDPEVTNEQVIVVSFNEEGFVQSIGPVETQRTEIPITDEETPTAGHEMTVMQQLLGNLGRFNRTEEF